MTDTPDTSVRHFVVDEMPRETLSPLLERTLTTGEKGMVAHVYLKKGCVVPMHQHENEQFTYVLDGALRFWIGSEDAESILVSTGEVLHIPAHVPHKAIAEDDTVDLDFFVPPRADWLDGTDAYLRG